MFCAGLFTQQEDSGLCWFSMGPAEDYRRNEYYLVGTVSS